MNDATHKAQQPGLRIRSEGDNQPNHPESSQQLNRAACMPRTRRVTTVSCVQTPLSGSFSGGGTGAKLNEMQKRGTRGRLGTPAPPAAHKRGRWDGTWRAREKSVMVGGSVHGWRSPGLV